MNQKIWILVSVSADNDVGLAAYNTMDAACDAAVGVIDAEHRAAIEAGVSSPTWDQDEQFFENEPYHYWCDETGSEMEVRELTIQP